MRILVADDHEFFRESVARFLRGLPGVTEVVSAPEGMSAIESSEAQAPEYVILDLHLSDMDGTEVALRIREVAPDAIIVLCTDDDPPHPSTAPDQCCDHLLPKDDLFEQLPKMIQMQQL